MIVDMPATSTTAVNKKLDELREKVGAVTMGRVLTLIIAPESDSVLEESIEAANNASHEHPSRIIVTMRGGSCVRRQTTLGRTTARGRRRRRQRGRGAATVRAAGQPRRQRGHTFLLPDIPVVAWWPDIAPAVPAQDPLGKLAIRRITDATKTASIRCRRSKAGYPGTPPVTPIWPGPASPTGEPCSPPPSTSRPTNRSSRHWFPV